VSVHVTTADAVRTKSHINYHRNYSSSLALSFFSIRLHNNVQLCSKYLTYIWKEHPEHKVTTKYQSTDSWNTFSTQYRGGLEGLWASSQ